MTNGSKGASLLNVLPDEEFLYRQDDIQELFNAGLDIVRSLQPSIFLSGSRKSGKTEILKRVYNRLFWEQENVIPFFHSLPKSILSAEAFCRNYFFRTIVQLIGFLKRDPMVVTAEEFKLNRIAKLAQNIEYPWLSEAIDDFHFYSRNQDLQAMSRQAITFPSSISLKSGFRAFVIVDDFYHLASLPSQDERTLLLGDFLQALHSRRAPLLLSGASKNVLQRLFRAVGSPSNLEIYFLKPWERVEAQLLFEKLCQSLDVPFEKGLSSFIVQQLNCNPFYVHSLVQAARRGQQGFRTPRQFADLYSYELTEGTLNLYFDSLVLPAAFNPFDKIKALELLHLCSRDTFDFSASHFSKVAESLDVSNINEILEALNDLGLIDYSLGIVSRIRDTVFKDWIEWNYTLRTSALLSQQASYTVTSDVLKRYNGTVSLIKYLQKVEQIRQLLLKMDCQSVPAALFDFTQFSSYAAIDDPEEKAQQLSHQEMMSLPEIISVTTHRVVMPVTDFVDQIMIGRGFEGKRYVDDTEVAWLVGYYPIPETIGLEEIERFYQRCKHVIKDANLANIRLWLLSEDRFNQAALSFAREHSIQTTSSSQLEMLATLIRTPLPLPKAEVLPKDVVTYDITIPLASDAELVAVRASDQIFDSVNFDEKSKGQIRMALIEACISAREAAPTKTGKIHITFHAAATKLTIRVYMEPGPNERREGDIQAPKSWSLKILQTLMDEVMVTQTRFGLELVMTKYLRTAETETT